MQIGSFFKRSSEPKKNLDPLLALSRAVAQSVSSWAFQMKPPERIEKILEDFTAEQATAEGWILVSESIFEAIGLYQTAISRVVSGVGDPTLTEKAKTDLPPNVLKAVEDFINHVPIFSEFRPYMKIDKGLSKLVQKINRSVSVSGNAFLEERYEMGRFKGIMLFQRKNFAWELREEFYTLVYLNYQYPELDQEGKPYKNPHFYHYTTETDEKELWGYPLVRGAGTDLKTLITLLLSIGNQARRFGNPPGLTLISQKNPAFLAAGQDGGEEYNEDSLDPDNDFARDFEKKIAILQKWILKGLSLSMKKGQINEMVTSIPGEVEIQSRTLGGEFNQFIDPEIFNKVAIQNALAWGVPPVLLDLDTSGSGIGSEQFHFAWATFNRYLQTLRTSTKAVVTQIVTNFLLSEGFTLREIEPLDFHFSEIHILSPKERVEMEQAQALADKTRAETADQLSLIDPDAALRYLEKYGLRESTN